MARSRDSWAGYSYQWHREAPWPKFNRIDWWRTWRREWAASFEKKELDDNSMPDLLDLIFQQEIPRFHDSSRLVASPLLNLGELNFGNNRIGDSGVQSLCAKLLSSSVNLRILKLHKNNVGSSGAQAVAELVAKSPRQIDEVHLSHNRLGPTDARSLMVAAAYRPYAQNGARPLWLRLERQQELLWDGFEAADAERWERIQEMIAFADERLKSMRCKYGLQPAEASGPLLCVVRFHDTCKPDFCCQAHAHGPIVQLPYLWNQGSAFLDSRLSGRCGREPDIAWKRETTSRKAQPFRKYAERERLSKTEPQVLFEDENIQVLGKGPYWVCVWDSYGSSRHVVSNDRCDLSRDRRSWEDIVQSGQTEHLDVFVARRFHDAMVSEWWRWHQDLVGSPAASSAGFLHRLDCETSGCIVRAKTQDGFDAMKNQLQGGHIRKSYLCLAHGTINPGSTLRIEDRLAYAAWNNEAYVDAHRGDWAETRVYSLALYSQGHRHYSLCLVNILTGRTHQIRLHLQHAGHPLVSDHKYNPLLVMSDREWCPRMFLHAYHLELRVQGQQRSVVAPLPTDLQLALEALTPSDDTGGHARSLSSSGIICGEVRELLSHMAVGTKSVNTEETLSDIQELENIRKDLRADVLAELSTAGAEGASLQQLSANLNIRWKLRRLQCGGTDPPGDNRDVARLIAFANEETGFVVGADMLSLELEH